MPVPTTQGNPSRYKPNPEDDRALLGSGLSSVYLALASAIEEIEENVMPEYRALAPATRKAIRSAESALRRAAFTLVLYGDPK